MRAFMQVLHPEAKLSLHPAAGPVASDTLAAVPECIAVAPAALASASMQARSRSSDWKDGLLLLVEPFPQSYR